MTKKFRLSINCDNIEYFEEGDRPPYRLADMLLDEYLNSYDDAYDNDLFGDILEDSSLIGDEVIDES